MAARRSYVSTSMHEEGRIMKTYRSHVGTYLEGICAMVKESGCGRGKEEEEGKDEDEEEKRSHVGTGMDAKTGWGESSGRERGRGRRGRGREEKKFSRLVRIRQSGGEPQHGCTGLIV